MRKSKRNVFGPKLREMRLEQGIALKDMLAKLQVKGWDIGRQNYLYLENGQRVIADGELLLILRVLGANLRDLE